MKKERTNCRWWQSHDWGKWMNDGLVDHYRRDFFDIHWETTPYKRSVKQKRYCKRCGTLQVKLVQH